MTSKGIRVPVGFPGEQMNKSLRSGWAMNDLSIYESALSIFTQGTKRLRPPRQAETCLLPWSKESRQLQHR